jgi:CDGSH-type Zn-finger protein
LRKKGIIRSMAKTVIKATINGPYEVNGDVDVVDAKGSTKPSGCRNVYLCRCGQSKTKPYCDGSHVRCGFKDP